MILNIFLGCTTVISALAWFGSSCISRYYLSVAHEACDAALKIAAQRDQWIARARSSQAMNGALVEEVGRSRAAEAETATKWSNAMRRLHSAEKQNRRLVVAQLRREVAR
jgi:hypothetical protein